MTTWLRHQGRAMQRALHFMVEQPALHAIYFLMGTALMALGCAAALLACGVGPWAAQHLPEPKLVLFMKSQASESQVHGVWEALATNPTVRTFDTRSPDDALAALRTLPSLATPLAQLDHNPLGSTFILHLRQPDARHLSALAQSLEAMPGVDHILSDAPWALKLEPLVQGTRLVGNGVAVISLLGWAMMGFLLAHQQSLRHQHQHRLLNQLGAGTGYLSRPYAYYGAFMGSLASTGALLVLYGLWRVYQELTPSLQSVFGFSLDLSFPGIGFNLALVMASACSHTIIFLLGRRNSPAN